MTTATKAAVAMTQRERTAWAVRRSRRGSPGRGLRRGAAGPVLSVGLWGALAASSVPAAAQPALPTDGVQIYGLVTPMIDRLKVSGAASSPPGVIPSMLGTASYNGNANGFSDTRMQSATSLIGIRGAEPLGGGLTAFFQLEHGLQVNTGTVTGPNPARFWNRNSAVGLRGGFGTVFAGIWDTPSAWSHLALTNDVRNPYAGDSSVIFVTPGFGVPSSVTADTRGNNPGDATFNRRAGNSLQYWTPKLGGFSGRIAYSLGENGAARAANGASVDASIFGVGLEYLTGPVMLRYAYQRQRNFYGLAWIGPYGAANPDAPGSTVQGAKDVNHRLIARYTISPAWIVQGTWDRAEYGVDGIAAGAMDNYRRDAWSALLIHRRGAHHGWLNYGRAADGRCTFAGGGNCVTRGVGATSWAAGYRYDFSRRTDIFVSYYRVNNRDSGQYGPFPRATAGIAPGARQSGVTLGIEHAF